MSIFNVRARLSVGIPQRSFGLIAQAHVCGVSRFSRRPCVTSFLFGNRTEDPDTTAVTFLCCFTKSHVNGLSI